MADFRFNCTACGQEIELDELWSGHQIQCPVCQKEITVPPKPSGPPHATLAAAKPGQPRLSIGQSQTERSAAARPVAPQAATLEQNLARAKQGQKANPMKWIVPVVVVLVLAVGGYFGYTYWQDRAAKNSEAAKTAATNSTDQASAATNSDAASAPAPQKELPVLPPVYTLDVAKAVIPVAKANGMVGGTNFVVEVARLDKVGTSYLLRLVQGTMAAPDRGFMVYLYPNAGEGVTGRTWTVSQDMKGRGVPQVVKVAKTNPRYAAQQKTIYSGYAMKLELGDVKDGMISGKIFLAVPPETEQSVVAGSFQAASGLDAAAVTPAVAPVPLQNPTAPVPAGAPPPMRPRRR
jgi:hypothetical protein